MKKLRLSIMLLGFFLLVYLWLALSSCIHKPPNNKNDICEIFTDKKRWYKHAKQSTKKWGTPTHVQMAILNHESSFIYDAKPQRKKLLGFIPWKRKSSAYGYAQVLNETWAEYIKDTNNSGADRDSFKDAIDFVGWYTYNTQQLIKVSKWDTYNQYLAYHEGRTGFKQETYKNKKWLIKIARKVESIANTYASQLKRCKF